MPRLLSFRWTILGGILHISQRSLWNHTPHIGFSCCFTSTLPLFFTPLPDITSQINNLHPSPHPSLCFVRPPTNTATLLIRSIQIVASFCYCKCATKNIHIKPTGAQMQESLLRIYLLGCVGSQLGHAGSSLSYVGAFLLVHGLSSCGTQAQQLW